MPLPATLRRLVKDYEALAADQSAAAAATSSARLRDLAYTLCVSTGRREVFDASQVARTCLDSAAAGPYPASAFPDLPVPSSSRPGCPAPSRRLSSRGCRSVVASDAAAAHRSAAATSSTPPSQPWPATGRPRACHEPSAARRRRLRTRTRGL
ncbi:DUF5133 domain-containing protein [Streptomyces sp. NBC_00016]